MHTIFNPICYELNIFHLYFRDLYTREVLDGFLSQALNIQMVRNRLTAIDDFGYVLTLDYTLKMLNIHERYECGVPVIIEGETGVGKTALVDMLSELWNQSLLLEWKKEQGRIMDLFAPTIQAIINQSTEISDSIQVN